MASQCLCLTRPIGVLNGRTYCHCRCHQSPISVACNHPEADADDLFYYRPLEACWDEVN
jgi:hypothetical protein